MAGIEVKLDLAGFGAFQGAAEAALSQAVEAAAEAVVNDARDRAPVDTGFMRDSTHWEPVGKLSAAVRADADYSQAVDEGSVKQPAQPWFTPAVEAERVRFPERVAEALAEAGT